MVDPYVSFLSLYTYFLSAENSIYSSTIGKGKMSSAVHFHKCLKKKTRGEYEELKQLKDHTYRKSSIYR